MKILVLSFYHPWISGGGHRPVCLLEEDIRHEDDVVFLFQSDAEIAEMEKFPLYFSKKLKLIRYIGQEKLIPMNPQAADITGLEYLLDQWKPDYVRSHNPVQSFQGLLVECQERGIVHIYDQMDYWDGFPVQPWGENTDLLYIQMSNARITISRWLAEKNKEKTDRCFLWLPNGLKESVRSMSHLPYDQVRIRNLTPRPRIIYSGALWPNWYDWELVVHLVESRPQYDFIFLGAVTASNDENDGRDVGGIVRYLQAKGNVTFTGQLSHQDIIPYLKSSNVAIIPFKVNDVTLACSPLKYYEYMAAFLPVVSSKLPELEEMPNVYLAESSEDFLKGVDLAVKKVLSEDQYQQIDEFCRNNTWKNRSNIIRQLVQTISNKP